jgi:hypothetical protein
MMDEMKIRSKWLTKLVSKYVMKAIKKSLGYDVAVDIGSIYVSVDDDDMAHLHLEVNADVNKDDLEKFIDEKIG